MLTYCSGIPCTSTYPTSMIYRARLMIRNCCLLCLVSLAFSEEQEALRIAHTADYAPFEWVGSDGERSGYLISVYEAWSTVSGRPIEWHTLPWAECLAALSDGRVDLITGASATPERLTNFRFGRELARAESRIFTHRSLPIIQNWDGLEGFLVGAVRGDQSANSVTTNAPHAELRLYDDYVQLVAAGLADEVRVLVGTSSVIHHLLTRMEGLDAFAIGQTALNSQPLAPMMRQDSAALARELEAGFARIPVQQWEAMARQWVPHSLEPLDQRPWRRWLLMSLIIAAAAGSIATLALYGNYLLRRRVRQHRAAEEQLRQDLGSFLQAVDDAALIGTDDRGLIRYLNRGAERLLGIRSEDVVGTISPLRWWERDERHRHAATQDAQASDFHLLAETAQHHGGSVIDLTWVHRDGSTFPVRVHVSALRNGTGDTTGYLLIARDLRQEEDLEHRRQHRARLESLGKLAGGIAHDFNNLLTGVVGFAELIATHPQASAEIRHNAQTIIAVGNRASELSRQLLRFSRRDAGSKQRLDLVEVLRQAISLVEHSLAKGITLNSDFSVDSAPLMGEHTGLESAVVNLIVNAIQAQGETGWVRISLKPCQDFWRVEIADGGPGIPESLRDKIFEPFFTTKPEGEGTGLGLAAVWGTVTAHQGTITINCPPEGGTTFTVLLPQDLDQRTAPAAVISPQQNPAASA